MVSKNLETLSSFENSQSQYTIKHLRLSEGFSHPETLIPCKCILLKKKKFKQLRKPIHSYKSYCCFHLHKVNPTVHKSHLAKTCFRGNQA